ERSPSTTAGTSAPSSTSTPPRAIASSAVPTSAPTSRAPSVSDCAATSERAFGPSLPRARTAEQARHSLTGRNLTGTAVNMTTARQDFEEAVRLLREGRDDEAAARCEVALRRGPDAVILLRLV